MPLDWKRIDWSALDPDQQRAALARPQRRTANDVSDGVRAILDDVRERGVSAEIVTMRGAVEVAPRLKLAAAICDLVSTGATLEANGLQARETVLESQAVLIKSPVAPEPGLQHLLDSIIERMAGVVSSQGAKYVMLNAPRSALDQITDILPGAGSPTVMPLMGREDLVAVHAVCQEAVFWETLEKLKAAGASAILVLPIEKMM